LEENGRENPVLEVAGWLDLFPHEFGIISDSSAFAHGGLKIHMQDNTVYDFMNHCNILLLIFFFNIYSNNSRNIIKYFSY
jgi:hypothetical protein